MSIRVLPSLLLLMPAAQAQTAVQVDPDLHARITAALPDKPAAPPAKARRLLIFTLTQGYRHASIPAGVTALSAMGRQTGAYQAVHSEDVELFEPDYLSEFDAVCFLNTTGELFTPADAERLAPPERDVATEREARLKRSLLNFVSSGKALIGIHAATDTFYKWPEYGEMIGGYFDGHPWDGRVTLRAEAPGHPLLRMFESQGLTIEDEIYQFRAPYDRTRQRVLLALDTSKTDMAREGIRRTDGDFAISWTRRHGRGRVFYCALGHRDEVYANPHVLRHYLAGIQWALGDLPADEPSPGEGPPAGRSGGPRALQAQSAPAASQPVSREEWKALFNGRDLGGWQGLVAPAGGPPARAKMSKEELAQAQAAADQRMRQHWSVRDGVLMFDGQGDSLCTVASYGNFEMTLDWKIEKGGDSGVYLRGCPQVQIWDADEHPEGSGGLYNNENGPRQPLKRADRPAGEWNTFRIRMIGDKVTVHLNDELVVDQVALENYWDRQRPVFPRGPIELQAHQTPVQFRNLRIRELPREPGASVPDRQERPDARPIQWRTLFNGKDLEGWTCRPGNWVVEDEVLARKEGGDFIWTVDQFGDFVLELEFKVPPKGNSGIFIRTADQKEWLHTGIEVQVLDSHGKSAPDKHDCGAIYDCLAPSRIACKPAGEWNQVEITCHGPRIFVILNNEPIIDMDLDEWTEPGKNPDGTPNKFRTAYKDMPRKGYIGFQDHGNPVWYRNVRIREVSQP
jgi:type 1 glutamine amidotransferase